MYSWEDNIKMDLREWHHLVQGRIERHALLDTLMSLRFSEKLRIYLLTEQL
jgi:hypothetical protein